MTTLEMQVEEKQNTLDDMFTRAKGVTREQLGNITNDKTAQLAGKKDQIVGTIQRDYSSSWPVRHSGWIFAGTAVAVLATIVAVFFSRRVFGTEA